MSTKQNIYETIREFVYQHEDCDFVVLTGDVSYYGIHKLFQLVPRNNQITLIIGNLYAKYFHYKSYTNTKREQDLIAIDDRSIEVYCDNQGDNNDNQEDNLRALVHAKAVIARRGTEIAGALVGSANLTKGGLKLNHEIMMHCEYRDFKHLEKYIQRHTKERNRATDRLIQIISKDGQINVPRKPKQKPETIKLETVPSKPLATNKTKPTSSKQPATNKLEPAPDEPKWKSSHPELVSTTNKPKSASTNKPEPATNEPKSASTNKPEPATNKPKFESEPLKVEPDYTDGGIKDSKTIKDNQDSLSSPSTEPAQQNSHTTATKNRKTSRPSPHTTVTFTWKEQLYQKYQQLRQWYNT